MTQMPENMDQSARKTQPQRKKTSTDRFVKIGFLLVVVIVGTVIWVRQLHGPELPGWGDNLSTAIEQAKDHNRQIIVFFSQYPMNEDDKHAVQNVIKMPEMEKIVQRGYVTVHLNTKDNSAEAKKYEVEATPTYLLLDSTGKEIRRTSGRMSIHQFTTTFLGVSLASGPSQ